MYACLTRPSLALPQAVADRDAEHELRRDLEVKLQEHSETISTLRSHLDEAVSGD